MTEPLGDVAAVTGKTRKPTSAGDIKNKTAASSRASNTVKRGLEKWAALQSNRPHNYNAELAFTVGDEEQKVKEAMDALAGTLDNYFKQNPLPSSMCFAAFSRTPRGATDVSVHGSAPDWYTTALETFLHSAAGAGHAYKLDSVSRREIAKERERERENE